MKRNSKQGAAVRFGSTLGRVAAAFVPRSDVTSKALPHAAEPTYPTSTFDFDAFSKKLLMSDDPLSSLRKIVEDITVRTQNDNPTAEQPFPSSIECFFAHEATEAGLFDIQENPSIMHIIRPRCSGLFYIRCPLETVSKETMLSLIALEAVINRVLFVCAWFSDLKQASLEDCYRINQHLFSVTDIEIPQLDIAYSDEMSEWAVRQRLAYGIESFRLPFRLVADFRLNLSEGNVAIRIRETPADVFPKTWLTTSPHEQLVVADETLRKQVASSYSLGVGQLLAKHAFACSHHITNVYVMSVTDMPDQQTCTWACNFERDAFLKKFAQPNADPFEIVESLGGTLHTEDAILLPVKAPIPFEDERFCPRRRYDSIDLSTRTLNGKNAEALGISHVSELAIHEDARRQQLADTIVRGLSASTESNVRTIMDTAGSDDDPFIRNAAIRTVNCLIAGTLDENNEFGIVEEFVSGDELSRATEAAVCAMCEQRPDQAVKTLAQVLSHLDNHDTFCDTDTVVWRSFPSYAGRMLYNRLYADDKRKVNLLPKSYLEAHLLMAAALLILDQPKEASVYAARCIEMSPLDARGYLRLVRCKERLFDFTAAIEILIKFLHLAHEPETIGAAYYRLAFMEWKAENFQIAAACYHKTTEFACSSAAAAMLELHALSLSTTENLNCEDVDALLAANDIPIAPTQEVASVLIEGAQATVDEELFSAAHSVVARLGALSGDDVLINIIRSIEPDPD